MLNQNLVLYRINRISNLSKETAKEQGWFRLDDQEHKPNSNLTRMKLAWKSENLPQKTEAFDPAILLLQLIFQTVIPINFAVKSNQAVSMSEIKYNPWCNSCNQWKGGIAHPSTIPTPANMLAATTMTFFPIHQWSRVKNKKAWTWNAILSSVEHVCF